MKWKMEKKQIRVAGLALFVIALSILFNHILEHETKFNAFKSLVRGTMSPIVLGAVLAYLQNPVLCFFERYCFTPLGTMLFQKEQRRRKFSRGFGILFTVILFMVLVFGGLYLVIPQVYLSLSKLVTEAPNYYNKVSEWISSLDPNKSEVGKYLMVASERLYSQAITYLNERILPNMDKIVAGITNGIVGGLKFVMNAILAVIISIYVMMEKETLVSGAKKLIYSILDTVNANRFIKGIRYADQVFGGFINGKIIDSFIIGALCYLFMVIVGYDYAVLVSIIVGVTNIIPYFGPIIGAVPCFLILFMVDIKQGLVFAVFVVILQQIDGNVIGPIILGDRLKISSMWILFAILVGGGFFGVPGMILGAPCFACVYALIGTLCENRLEKKHMPVDTEVYYDILYVDPEDGGIVKKEELTKPDSLTAKQKTHDGAEKEEDLDNETEEKPE